MKGKIHYSKHGHVQLIGENNRVYYTGVLVSECALANQMQVEFDILDDALSKGGNIRIAEV